MSLQAVSAAGTIIIPILILLTYKWQKLDTARDLERSLRESIQDMRSHSDSFLVRVAYVEVRDSSNLVDKYFLFRPEFDIYLTILIEEAYFSERVWTTRAFEHFCEIKEYEAELVHSEGIADGTLVKFKLDSREEREPRNFFKMLPSFLEILKDTGIMERGISPDDDVQELLDALQGIESEDREFGSVGHEEGP